jgi:hypothetical protein
MEIGMSNFKRLSIMISSKFYRCPSNANSKQEIKSQQSSNLLRSETNDRIQVVCQVAQA